MEDSHDPLADSLCGYLNQGTPPDYVELGYVPHESDPTQSASMTFEYAYDDWCVAVVAAGLGQAVDPLVCGVIPCLATWLPRAAAAGRNDAVLLRDRIKRL